VSWEGIESTVADVLKARGSAADPGAFNTAWRTRQLLFSMYNTMMGRGYEPLETYGYKPDWTTQDFLELAKLLEREQP
jgi:hypothetical protein